MADDAHDDDVAAALAAPIGADDVRSAEQYVFEQVQAGTMDERIAEQVLAMFDDLPLDER